MDVDVSLGRSLRRRERHIGSVRVRVHGVDERFGVLLLGLGVGLRGRRGRGSGREGVGEEGVVWG